MKSELKKLVIESAAQGAAWRREIRAMHDRARYDAWTNKRSVGRRTRHLLLAYAFVRGVPYAVVEDPGHRTDDLINVIAYEVTVGLGLSMPVGTRDEVKAWLNVPATPARLAQIAAAHTRAHEAAATHRAEATARRERPTTSAPHAGSPS